MQLSLHWFIWLTVCHNISCIFIIYYNIINICYVLIFICSAFTQLSFLWFIKRYSTNFLFGVFLYFTLGTFGVTMAAMKQVLAMAVLFLSFPYYEQKKWIRFYLLVFVAMLIHTYAIMLRWY